MNVDDLVRELKRCEINETACFVLPARRAEGAICLTHEDDGRWLVSLVERGENVVEKYFLNQDEACRYFLKYVISDPTYFKDFSMEKYENLKKKSANLLEEYGYKP